MQAGETMTASDGAQVMLYPMDYLYITQVSSPGSYSHCCGSPVDMVGSTAQYPLYAPCDCFLVYSNAPYLGNTRMYQSASEVYYATPSGSGWSKGYITFGFTHDSNPPSQTSFKQGELIGHSGIAGNVTGDHCHFETSTGQVNTLIDSGVTCSGGNRCWMQPNSTPINQICFINNTTIVDTKGMEFQTWDGSPGPGPGPEPEPTKVKGVLFLDPKSTSFIILK